MLNQHSHSDRVEQLLEFEEQTYEALVKIQWHGARVNSSSVTELEYALRQLGETVTVEIFKDTVWLRNIASQEWLAELSRKALAQARAEGSKKGARVSRVSIND